MGVAHERQRAVDKAQKVFRHGASTTASGEKEKAVAVLIGLCQKHRLVLSDLDPQFPARLDVELLRVRIGLVQATVKGTDKAGPQPRRQAGSGPSAGAASRPGTGSQDVLFRTMGADERRRCLQGPMFSQGLLHAVKNTDAYLRLLTEMRSLNASNMGRGLSEHELLRWLERALTRQGSSVTCRTSSNSVFDDIAAYCRSHYLAESEQHRQAEQRRSADQEKRRNEEARRQAEEARAKRERQAAEQRRQAARRAQERERPAPQDRGEAEVGGGTPNGRGGAFSGPAGDVDTFVHAFENPAEAKLYFKVARRQVEAEANVRSFTRQERFYVELRGPASLKESVDRVYLQVLHDLQIAASAIRTEAARAREEAVRQAEAAYARQCEQAFQVAVDSYTA